jgi:hypothetical protein
MQPEKAIRFKVLNDILEKLIYNSEGTRKRNLMKKICPLKKEMKRKEKKDRKKDRKKKHENASIPKLNFKLTLVCLTVALALYTE